MSGAAAMKTPTSVFYPVTGRLTRSASNRASLEANSAVPVKREVTIRNVIADVPSTDVIFKPSERGVFTVMDTAPSTHKFKNHGFVHMDNPRFLARVCEEVKLLKTSLPSGIWVTAFEDRLDLFSAMIRGPEKTPYEDALFFFDFQLSLNYPLSPPKCFYIPYSGRLNPNLYDSGTVCVSLLGTWGGTETEMWTTSSNLLQVIVSIQGLILVQEPYFNEPGCTSLKGTDIGRIESRKYNETVISRVLQAMTEIIGSPHQVFTNEIKAHLAENGQKLVKRMESWIDMSVNHVKNPRTRRNQQKISRAKSSEDLGFPEFPLFPTSGNFFNTNKKLLDALRSALERMPLGNATPVVGTLASQI